MGLLKQYNKIKSGIRGAINGYKHGGSVNAVIAEINYGGLFTDNDVVLVSGGSKGIGLSIAQKLLNEGATVIITGRSITKLKDVASEIKNNRLYVLELDIALSENFEAKITEIEKKILKFM